MYCSKRCTGIAQNRKKGMIPRVEYEAARRNPSHWFRCECCGIDVHRKLSIANAGPNRFCSMKCRKDASLAKSPPYSAYYCNVCRACNAPFAAKTDRLQCSRKCELEYGRRKALEIAQTQHRASAKVVVCDQCKCQFSPLYGSSHATLCTPCSAERTKVTKRIAKMQRAAMMRGVESERVDPMKVFARDKWRCRLCGVATPKSKRGTYGDNAPELDHIMPLSKGGPHTYLNTQCACRKCNHAKSDKPMGQMLLVG